MCILEQHDEDKELTPENEKDTTFEDVTSKMDDDFKMNSGRDKVIFSESHPYFQVPEKDIDYAKNNFNCVIPESD